MKKNWFTVKQLYPNVWGIGEFLHFEKVISYLFVGNDKTLLFDSGMGIGNIKNTVRKITALPVKVVNSHCHYDHIGGNKLFTDISILETNWNKSIVKNGINAKKLKILFKKYSKEHSNKLNSYDETYSIPPFNYTKLSDGQIINIKPFRFVVIHTPGHTPDSICLYETTNKLLLTGDTIYDGPIYLHLKESNADDYTKSIIKIKKYKKVIDVLPGHNSFSMKII